MLRLVSLPFCTVAMVAPWNEPPTRRFVAYRCRDGFPRVLGHPVIDEFATLSSPIFLGPRALAGKLYNAGLSLAHRRDPEMAIDLGWPPLVVGLAQFDPIADPPADWEDQLLNAVVGEPSVGEPLATADGFERMQVGAYRLERVAIGEAVLWATDAPLLPKQLARVCEASAQPFVLALATPALVRPAEHQARDIEALSELRLGEVLAAARELER